MEARIENDRVNDMLERTLERIWAMQGREGTFADYKRKRMGMTEEERKRELVEQENRKPGDLHLIDGYDCKKCLNRGEIWGVLYDGKHWREMIYRCDCAKVRASIRRMKKSGLENSLKRFEDFEATEDWQENMLNIARTYANADLTDGKSLFIGGAVGGGKTHVCSAVCRELLHKGHEVIYMPWMNESRRIKAISNTEEGVKEIELYSQAEILYIDDLFKPTKDQPDPTAADVKLAYEIINYRYINKLPTIVSCEKYMMELLEYDEGTISRLYERAKAYTVNVARKPERNYRMKGAGDMV